MTLCLVDKAAVRKRLEKVMARLICADALHVLITVDVETPDGRRQASKVLLPTEVGTADATEILCERIEAATAAAERIR